MRLPGRAGLPPPPPPPPPPPNPLRSHGFLLRVAGVEFELADEVMGAVPGPDFLRPRSGEDVHVGSGIQFPSSARFNHLFSVHDPYGIHNSWSSLFLLGLSSSETATLKTFRAAPRFRTCDTKAIKGVNC